MKIFLNPENQNYLEILKKSLEELHLDFEVVKNDYYDINVKIEEQFKAYEDGKHLVIIATLTDQSGDEHTGSSSEMHLYEETLEKSNSKDKLCAEAIQNAYANYLLSSGDLIYRKKALGIIFREQDKKLLIIQKPHYSETDWDFPGGGIDDGETGEEALLRELYEELGTGKFEVVEKSNIENSYAFPDFLVARWLRNNENLKFKGQTQLQYIVKFIGEDIDLKIDNKEISKFKWVSYDELFEHLNMTNQESNIRAVIESSSLKL